MSLSLSQIEQISHTLPDIFHKHPVDIGLILGSGLNTITQQFDILCRIPYQNIQDFPISTAPTHHGELLLAEYNNKRLVIFNGRFHLYEGYSAEQTALPVYLLHQLRCQKIITTNASGALNPSIKPTSIVAISDHINFTGHSPLIGDNDEKLGERFVDLTQAYHPDLRALALECAQTLDINLHEGIYAAVTGPEFETSAQRRWLRATGCDIVGMSTAMEVIAANHCRIPVLAFSAVTNGATGGEDQQADDIQIALNNANVAAGTLSRLLPTVITKIV